MTRGQTFALGSFDGPAVRLGEGSGAHQRLARWVGGGDRAVLVTDRGNREREYLDVYQPGAPGEASAACDEDLGHPVELLPDPKGERLALVNHLGEVWVVELQSRRPVRVDHTRFGMGAFTEGFPYGRPIGLNWSPDGRFLAYARPESLRTTAICVWDRDDGHARRVTDPVLHDTDPVFDPRGRYLYFLSRRIFRPVADALTFDLGFPRGIKPYLVPLRAEDPSPFLVPPENPKDKKESEPDEKAPPVVRIDWEGITERVVPFPVDEGLYRQLAAFEDRVLWTVAAVEDAEAGRWLEVEWPANGTVESYDLKTGEKKTVMEHVTTFRLSGDGRTTVYRSGDRLTVLPTGEAPDKDAGDKPGRKSGIVDLRRITVDVRPRREWAQVLGEAWRTMRREFWTEDMSGVDWEEVYREYSALLPRIRTRGELSDLIWEMQAELGTSHAYEFGGDRRRGADHPHATLAADYAWDPDAGVWRVSHIVAGDPSNPEEDSPLRAPGARIEPGDLLLAIDGIPLDHQHPPESVLVGRAHRVVALTVAGPRAPVRTVWVKALSREHAPRYRAWVERSRARVHTASGGRVGYIHIPDMGWEGFAEFHRGFLAEVAKDALLVDVRGNGGGIVSPLILELLMRKPVGWEYNRYGEAAPYPFNARRGPLVALADELSASDGDIFTHAWKLYGLGPVVGTRTWGGVNGYDDTRVERFVDGSVGIQPGMALWFNDVGHGVENYGTDPTVWVDYAPQDYAAGRDPQLERAIEEALRLLADEPPAHPPEDLRPRLTRPPLPPPQRP